MAAHKAVSVTDSATRIVAKNLSRIMLKIYNNDATAIVFLGDDNTVTTSNGWPLGPKAAWSQTINVSQDAVRFFPRTAIFGIVASGTADVRVLEFDETT
jgi:hypothetical protein